MTRCRDEILNTWVERVRQDVASARRERGPALIDHLPMLLESLEHQLGAGQSSPAEVSRVIEVSKIHGEQRVYQDYEVADVLLEYQILARVIFDVLEGDGMLPKGARNTILRVIQRASFEAVEGFVRDQRYRDLRPLKLDRPTRGWRGVALSVLGILGATVVQFVMWSLIKPASYLFYFPAIILLTLYAEGWTAIALSLVLSQFIFNGIPFEWGMQWPQDYARGAILLGSGALIIVLRNQLLTARARAYLERTRSVTFARLQNCLAEIGRLGLSERGIDALLADGLPLITRALEARETRLHSFRPGEVPAGANDAPVMTPRHGALEVTIPGHAGPYGYLRVETANPRDFTADEKSFLSTVAGTLTTALKRRHFEDQLRSVNDELGRSNAELSRFAAIAAHDLKAPLNSISQFAELIGESAPPDSETREYLDIMARATERMRNLVDRLLSYSRVGAIDAVPVRVDVQSVLEAVTYDLGAAISAGAALVTSDPLPIVHGDQVAVQQLFQNLIANALKFVAPGIRPRVHVGATPAGSFWRFSIRDNGIGIDSEEAREIFEPFRRLRAKAYEGTGLGLAICLRIVERHGGRIWMTSHPGRGSEFVFTLPRVDT